MKWYYWGIGSMSNADAQIMSLVYLFLSSESRISDGSYSAFEKIGNRYEGFAAAKGEIIRMCEEALAEVNPNKSRFTVVSEAFAEIAKPQGFFSLSGLDPVQQRSAMWVLVSLVRSNGKVSSTETDLVEIWRCTCRIDQSVLDEMRDTAQTFRALKGYKQWANVNKAQIEQDWNDTTESINQLIKLG
ncbi:MAG: hypothetical protein LBP88_02265 [Treponema sp.]|jgi:hypothetical protein|nr:hypothetical protein [Treponema sp.]